MRLWEIAGNKGSEPARIRIRRAIVANAARELTQIQKWNEAPRLMVRFADPVPKLLASAVDSPNSGEPSTPTGAARFTWFSTFSPATKKPRLYLRRTGGFFAGFLGVAP